jgi:arsenical pump membrane protein
VGTASLTTTRILTTLAVVCVLVAVVLDPGNAAAAARQDWPPFVLVVGLLLIGLVADRDGLFAAVGSFLAARARSGALLYAGAMVVVAAVTAVLNLDTSVAFLTPVLIYTARRRGGGEAPLLYGCLLMSNAASLLLPGSNLTNLIVLGHLHLSGHTFFVRMAPAWAVAIVVTAVVVAAMERREFGRVVPAGEPVATARTLIAPAALVAVVVLVVVLRNPAIPVLAVGAVAAALRVGQRQVSLRQAQEAVGVSTLAALFALAVVLGTVGRDWSGPEQLLGHLDRWGTAFVAAGVAVLVNNLPAASLLAAHAPRHPFALLIGLNLGPNLCVTGSLSWLLWLRAARTTGARPSLARATRIGAVAAPLSIAAAVAMLAVTSLR